MAEEQHSPHSASDLARVAVDDQSKETSSTRRKKYSCTELFVRNLPNKISELEIFTFFGKFGTVTTVRKGYKNKPFAFVTYEKRKDARKVLFAKPEVLMYKKKQLYIEKARGDTPVFLTRETKQVTEDSEKILRQGFDRSTGESYWSYCPLRPTDTLPTKILEHIFSFLCTRQRFLIERVCKRWRKIGKILNQREKLIINFTIGWWVFDSPTAVPTVILHEESHLQSILSRCGNSLRQIEVSNQSCLGGKVLESVAAITEFCPHLVELTLVNVPLWDDSAGIAERCIQLTVVRLENVYKFDFVKKCNKIEVLEISRTNLSANSFEMMSQTLKNLHIDRCPCLQMDDVRQSLANVCGLNLEELHLILLKTQSFDEDVLLKMFCCYKDSLKVLQLDTETSIINTNSFAESNKIEKLQQNTWLEGVTIIQNLQELSLCNCSDVNDGLLHFVANNCRNIRVLKIRETTVTDKGISYLTALPDLTVLDISKTKQILGIGLEELAREGRLEELHARLTNVTSPNETYGLFVTYCQNLRLLDVRCNANISNLLLQTLYAANEAGFLKQQLKIFVFNTAVHIETVKHCKGFEILQTSTIPNCSKSDYDECKFEELNISVKTLLSMG